MNEHLSIRVQIMKDPFEHTYTPEAALKRYKELSAKYPQYKRGIVEDFKTAERVGKLLKSESQFNDTNTGAWHGQEL